MYVNYCIYCVQYFSTSGILNWNGKRSEKNELLALLGNSSLLCKNLSHPCCMTGRLSQGSEFVFSYQHFWCSHPLHTLKWCAFLKSTAGCTDTSVLGYSCLLLQRQDARTGNVRKCPWDLNSTGQKSGCWDCRLLWLHWTLGLKGWGVCVHFNKCVICVYACVMSRGYLKCENWIKASFALKAAPQKINNCYYGQIFIGIIFFCSAQVLLTNIFIQTFLPCWLWIYSRVFLSTLPILSDLTFKHSAYVSFDIHLLQKIEERGIPPFSSPGPIPNLTAHPKTGLHIWREVSWYGTEGQKPRGGEIVWNATQSPRCVH